jgi:hypothetical protein
MFRNKLNLLSDNQRDIYRRTVALTLLSAKLTRTIRITAGTSGSYGREPSRELLLASRKYEDSEIRMQVQGRIQSVRR